MFSEPSHFAVTVAPVARTTVVTVAGELDIATGPLLGAMLDALNGLPPTEVVFDMSRLDFVDAGGLRFVHIAALDARLAGRRVRIRNVSERLRFMLRITGVDQIAVIES